jgi:myo-inositol-1(or 4)-monophosphatase
MLEQIKEVVRHAGQIILDAHNIREGVESKQGRANFVTKYDVEVQDYLFRELAALFPKAAFIGEEDGRKGQVFDEYCFIIDPIDGTTNFIFDYRHSAISVGLLYRKEIIAGVVYNPYLDELFYAEKGKGAYLNGRALKVTDLSLSEGIVAVGTCPYNREKAEETFQLARKLYDRALDIRRSGSAALDICYVAAGRFVLYYELLLQPWDYAAASLILTEAGGCITATDKEALSYASPCSIMAATPSASKEYFEIQGIRHRIGE